MDRPSEGASWRARGSSTKGTGIILLALVLIALAAILIILRGPELFGGSPPIGVKATVDVTTASLVIQRQR